MNLEVKDFKVAEEPFSLPASRFLIRTLFLNLEPSKAPNRLLPSALKRFPCARLGVRDITIATCHGYMPKTHVNDSIQLPKMNQAEQLPRVKHNISGVVFPRFERV